MPPWETVGATLFVIVLFAGCYASIIDLPGTFVVIFDAFLYAWITGFHTIGAGMVGLLFMIALLVEGLDLYIRSRDTKAPGTTRKDLIASGTGAVIGMVSLTPFLYGLGTFIGFSAGGFAGIFLVAYVREQRLKPAFRTVRGKFAARMSGRLLKSIASTITAIIVLSRLYS